MENSIRLKVLNLNNSQEKSMLLDQAPYKQNPTRAKIARKKINENAPSCRTKNLLNIEMNAPIDVVKAMIPPPKTIQNKK